MYLTVRRGDATENQNHSWSEVNQYSVGDYQKMGVKNDTKQQVFFKLVMRTVLCLVSWSYDQDIAKRQCSDSWGKFK